MTEFEPVVVAGEDTTVTWGSPSSGPVQLGWESPFLVDGVDQPITEFPRHESPWGSIDRLQTHHRFASSGKAIDLDFDNLARMLEA